MARKAQSDNMLEKMRDQHAQDKVNDRMETGSFPTVRKKPRKDLNRASNKSRLLSSILIALMCALLGFAYMSQINNTKSTYETMDESELVRLLNESNTQISNLEQRKTQLNSQLNSLKSAANEQEQARKIAKQNEETSGLISGRLPAKGQGVTIRIGRGLTTKVDASIMFNLIEELRNAGAEVIAINNVRVITSTYIQDAEEGLIVDGTTIKPTYTVKAIGNPQELSNAVDIAGGVGAQLQVKYGSNVNVQPSDSIIIDEVREATQNQYAKTVEEGIMTNPIPSAGETTIIGLPAINVLPITTTGDRPLTQEDLDTITRLSEGTALLISARGAVSGSRYLLDEDEITVGRDPRADILLDDSTVSRQHAVFRRVNGQFFVVDAGSLNGTYVNRQRVDQATLKNGDEIMIGKFRLVFFTKSAIISQ